MQQRQETNNQLTLTQLTQLGWTFFCQQRESGWRPVEQSK